MAEYFGVAKDEGLTDKEIGAVEAIVLAVAGGKIRATFLEARTKEMKRRRNLKKDK